MIPGFGTIPWGRGVAKRGLGIDSKQNWKYVLWKFGFIHF